MDPSDVIAIIGAVILISILVTLIYNTYTVTMTRVVTYSLDKIKIDRFSLNATHDVVTIHVNGFAVAYVVKPNGVYTFKVISGLVKLIVDKRDWVFVLSHGSYGCSSGRIPIVKNVALKFYPLPTIHIPKGTRTCNDVIIEPKPVTIPVRYVQQFIVNSSAILKVR